MTPDVASGHPTALTIAERDVLMAIPFTDSMIQESPTGYYQALREGDPVHYDENLGMYLVSRYKDLEVVLRDPITYSQELGYNKQMAYGYLDELKAILIRDGGGFFPDVANIDPPRHTRVRRLLQHAFTPRRMKALEPQFERLVSGLIDRFCERGSFEGLKDLALPMAIGFSKTQLKVEDLDIETIHRWGSAYLSQFSLMQTREQFLDLARQLCDLQHYLIRLVRMRMAHREDDMLSDLVEAHVHEPPLTFDELVATARAILINTHDSLSTALTNILFKVATDAEVARHFYAAADDDQRMGRLIEELLRLEPPVRALSRITTRPTVLGGKQLAEGSHLLILFASANDDGAVFSHARAFDVTRPNLSRSLTFGGGIHLCLGIALARMQLRVAARQVATRLKGLRLAVPKEEIRYAPNVALLAMKSLPLAFEPGG